MPAKRPPRPVWCVLVRDVDRNVYRLFWDDTRSEARSLAKSLNAGDAKDARRFKRPRRRYWVAKYVPETPRGRPRLAPVNCAIKRVRLPSAPLPPRGQRGSRSSAGSERRQDKPEAAGSRPAGSRARGGKRRRVECRKGGRS